MSKIPSPQTVSLSLATNTVRRHDDESEQVYDLWRASVTSFHYYRNGPLPPAKVTRGDGLSKLSLQWGSELVVE